MVLAPLKRIVGQLLRSSFPQFSPIMRASLLSILFYSLLPLILLVAIVDLATMGVDKRQRLTVNRLHASGFSQRAIASQLGITRHRVRVCLA